MTIFKVIEGLHKNPNDFNSLYPETKITHGPFSSEQEAEEVAKRLIQKNIDNYNHRAWVVNN